MGVGNFYLNNAETVYIDYDDIYPASEFDDIFYEDMIDRIREHLPVSFHDVENKWHGDGLIISENGFYKVVVTGWQVYYAVSIVLKDDAEKYPFGINPLGKYLLHDTSKRLFDKLYNYYDLSVRQTGWTSIKYTKKAA